MPGPAPTPTAVLANRGSWRAKDRLGEPLPRIPTTGEQEPPAALPDAAKALWRSLAPRLVNTGQLTAADLEAFGRYCRLSVVWDSAMRDLEAETTRDNTLTVAKLEEMLRKLEAGFGLTPADRTRIKTDTPQTQTGKARFFT